MYFHFLLFLFIYLLQYSNCQNWPPGRYEFFVFYFIGTSNISHIVWTYNTGDYISVQYDAANTIDTAGDVYPSFRGGASANYIPGSETIGEINILFGGSRGIVCEDPLFCPENKDNVYTYNDVWILNSTNPSIPHWKKIQEHSEDPGSLFPSNYYDSGIPMSRTMSHFTCFPKHCYLFGGYHSSQTERGFLNDLWRLNLDTYEWVWLHGSNTFNSPGNYPTELPVTNVGQVQYNWRRKYFKGRAPRARGDGIMWADIPRNRLFLYGGKSDYENKGILGDIWEYDIGSNTWLQMHGNRLPYEQGKCSCTFIDQGTPLCSININMLEQNFDICLDNAMEPRYGVAAAPQLSTDKMIFFGGITQFGASGAIFHITPDKHSSGRACNSPIEPGCTMMMFSNLGEVVFKKNYNFDITTNHLGSRAYSMLWHTSSAQVFIFGGYALGNTFKGWTQDLWVFDYTTGYKKLGGGDNRWSMSTVILCSGEESTSSVHIHDPNNPSVRYTDSDISPGVRIRGTPMVVDPVFDEPMLYLFGGEGTGKFDVNSGESCLGALNDLWYFKDLLKNECYPPNGQLLPNGTFVTDSECFSKLNSTIVNCELKCDGSYGPVSDGIFAGCLWWGFHWIEGTCISCQPGYYISEGICKRCDAGTYSTTKDSNTCSDVSPGYFGNYGATSLLGDGDCLPGFYCPQGSSSPKEYPCPRNYSCLQNSYEPTPCYTAINPEYESIQSPEKASKCYLIPTFQENSGNILEDSIAQITLFHHDPRGSYTYQSYPEHRLARYYVKDLITRVDYFPPFFKIKWINDTELTEDIIQNLQGWDDPIVDSQLVEPEFPYVPKGFRMMLLIPDKDWYGEIDFKFSECVEADEGSDNFEDRILCSHSQAVHVIVQGINDPPYWKSDEEINFITDGSSDYIEMNFDKLAVDAENNTFYIELGGTPIAGSLRINPTTDNWIGVGEFWDPANSIYYFPNHNNNGRVKSEYVSFYIRANDGEMSTDKEVTVTIACSPGFYVNLWGNKDNNDVCTTCPTGSDCSSDGIEMPKAKPGYWRSQGDTSIFLSCSPAEACLSGAGFGLDRCATGYFGIRCGSCSTKFFKLNNVCTSCPESRNWFLYITGGIIILLLVITMLWVATKGPNIAFVAIAFTYMQSIAIVSKIKLKWPGEISSIFSFMSVFNLNVELLSVECDAPEFSWEYKYIAWLLLPIGMFLLLFCAVILIAIKVTVQHCCCRKSKQSVDFWISYKQSLLDGVYLVLKAFLLFLVFIYISLSSSVAEFFDCTDQEDGLFYLDADPSFLCYDKEWNFLLPFAVVGFIVYAIGIPIFFFIVLSRKPLNMYSKPLCCGFNCPKRFKKYEVDPSILENTMKMNTSNRSRTCSLGPKDPIERAKYDESYKNWMKSYGVLVNNYNARCYYWEVIVMIRKVTISFCKLFASEYPLLQGTIAIFILFLSILFQVAFAPWNSTSLNRMEFFSLLSSILVLLGGLLCYGEPNMSDPTLRTYLGYTMLAIFGLTGFFVGFNLFKAAYVSYKRWKSKREAALPKNAIYNSQQGQMDQKDDPQQNTQIAGPNGQSQILTSDQLASIQSELKSGQFDPSKSVPIQVVHQPIDKTGKFVPMSMNAAQFSTLSPQQMQQLGIYDRNRSATVAAPRQLAAPQYQSVRSMSFSSPYDIHQQQPVQQKPVSQHQKFLSVQLTPEQQAQLKASPNAGFVQVALNPDQLVSRESNVKVVNMEQSSSPPPYQEPIESLEKKPLPLRTWTNSYIDAPPSEQINIPSRIIEGDENSNGSQVIEGQPPIQQIGVPPSVSPVEISIPPQPSNQPIILPSQPPSVSPVEISIPSQPSNQPIVLPSQPPSVSPVEISIPPQPSNQPIVLPSQPPSVSPVEISIPPQPSNQPIVLPSQPPSVSPVEISTVPPQTSNIDNKKDDIDDDAPPMREPPKPPSPSPVEISTVPPQTSNIDDKKDDIDALPMREPPSPVEISSVPPQSPPLPSTNIDDKKDDDAPPMREPPKPPSIAPELSPDTFQAFQVGSVTENKNIGDDEEEGAYDLF